MAEDKVQIKEGYSPLPTNKKGYQPVPSNNLGTENIQGGYQPSTSQGTNPTNPPSKK